MEIWHVSTATSKKSTRWKVTPPTPTATVRLTQRLLNYSEQINSTVISGLVQSFVHCTRTGATSGVFKLRYQMACVVHDLLCCVSVCNPVQSTWNDHFPFHNLTNVNSVELLELEFIRSVISCEKWYHVLPSSAATSIWHAYSEDVFTFPQVLFHNTSVKLVDSLNFQFVGLNALEHPLAAIPFVVKNETIYVFPVKLHHLFSSVFFFSLSSASLHFTTHLLS